MKTGIVRDWRYTEHEMGAFHPENPQRINVIYEMLDKEFPLPLKEIKPRFASEEEIEMVHSRSYIQTIKETAGKERVYLDPDTSTCSRSYETALLAAGGLLKAIDLVMEGKIENGFALVRPPGHHAERNRAMGFCLFNNVALGAEYLRKKYGMEKILIVDWDLHHGNGTQNSFYERKDVLYFSLHQFPHYPGTGYWNEIGRGEGEGFTVNIPLLPGKNDEDYLFIFRKILLPIAFEYEPNFILVSAGFDIYKGDPLGGMMISEEGFGMLTEELLSLAAKTSKKRILFTLEGGYNLKGLREGVKQVLLTLSQEEQREQKELKVSPALEKELTPIFEIQKKYWRF